MFIGIDTSNYTTSVALFDLNNKKIKNYKKPLMVRDKNIGLRQSEAVFQHVNNIHSLLSNLLNDACGKIYAVGVSSQPRNLQGSYMPCFLTGLSAAKILAAALKIPCYEFSHQQGHLMAALYSSNRLDLAEKPFIAFHVSGGTTEILFVNGDTNKQLSCEIIGGSDDLKMGQAIDRVGRMLNIPFPAGKQLDEMSLSGIWTEPIKITVKGFNCSISGLENKCRKLIEQNFKPEDIARFTIEYLFKTLDKITQNIIKKYGNIPLVFAGGVMSNSIINQRLSTKYKACFASPEFSSDNAAGLALLASLKIKGICNE